MSFKATFYRDRFRKRVKRGFAGYPVGTVAYYGPDNQRASKVAVAVIPVEGAEPGLLERWFSDTDDVRTNPEVLKAVLQFLSSHAVKSVVATAGILGCPHEEGTDYPEGETCPACPYWAHRDRFSGDVIAS